MINKIPALLTVMMLLVSTGSIMAGDLYRWVDSDGVLHVSDRPPVDDSRAETIPAREIQTIKTVSLGNIKQTTLEAMSLQSTGSSGTITMYGTQWCGYCARARKYFAANNIPYREYDIESSARGAREHQALGGGGVPVFVLGKKTMRGFSAKSFARFYGNG